MRDGTARSHERRLWYHRGMSNPTPDTHDAAAKEERSSGYARLPKIARDEASKALDVAEHAAERLAEGTKDAARHLGRDVGRGLRAASHAFDEPAGTKIEFQLQATGAGDLSSMISQASLGVPWSYTSN